MPRFEAAGRRTSSSWLLVGFKPISAEAATHGNVMLPDATLLVLLGVPRET